MGVDPWGDEDDEGNPRGPLCRRCDDGYVSFEHKGRRRRVIKTINNDPDEDKIFEAACVHAARRRAGRPCKLFYPRRTLKVRKTNLKVKSRHRGLNKADFRTKFEHDYGEYKLVEKDLLAADNSTFKGVVVTDDGSFGSLGTEYVMEQEFSVIEEEVRMDPRDQHRADQHEEVWQVLNAPSGEENIYLKNVRNGSVPTAEILQALADHKAA